MNITMKQLFMIEQLISSPLIEYQILMLQKLTSTILQKSAFMLHVMYTDTSGGNKHMYIADKRSCYMLKLAAKFGSVSDLLYIFSQILCSIFILPVVFTPDISLFLYKHMITIQISTLTLSALCLDFVLVDIFLNKTRVYQNRK